MEVGESNIAYSAWKYVAWYGKSHPTYLRVHLFRPYPGSTLQKDFSGAVPQEFVSKQRSSEDSFSFHQAKSLLRKGLLLSAHNPKFLHVEIELIWYYPNSVVRS